MKIQHALSPSGYHNNPIILYPCSADEEIEFTRYYVKNN